MSYYTIKYGNTCAQEKKISFDGFSSVATLSWDRKQDYRQVLSKSPK